MITFGHHKHHLKSTASFYFNVKHVAIYFFMI